MATKKKPAAEETQALEAVVQQQQTEIAKLTAQLELMRELYDQRGAAVAAAPEVKDTEAQLSRLTLKQHAVLTATLGGLSYQEIADIMNVDVTTAKLHLKAAMTHLGVENRQLLGIRWGTEIEGIPTAEYRTKFGVGKRWWEELDSAVLRTLTTKTSSLYKAAAKKSSSRRAK